MPVNETGQRLDDGEEMPAADATESEAQEAAEKKPSDLED
jgi:hypothetical protein